MHTVYKCIYYISLKEVESRLIAMRVLNRWAGLRNNKVIFSKLLFFECIHLLP